MSSIAIYIEICIGAFVWLAWLLRRDRLSLGLPIAYLGNLLLIHVPGAFTRIMTNAFDFDRDIIGIGIRYTAIGCVCFVAGVYIARFLNRGRRISYRYVEQREFWNFCLIGGLFVSFGLRFLSDLPSVRAALDRGALLWTLGALLGLRFAVSQGNLKSMMTWGLSCFIYPILILLFAGFLSYGSIALIIVASALVISVRSPVRVIVGGCLVVYLGLTVFVNYFEHRTEYRDVAWSGASTESRVDAALDMFSNFKFFDPTDIKQLNALNVRLNQNYFVGLAALRLEQGQVAYLHGRSLWEGVEALVPRFLWPDKPVYGGSGRIVADMTGLQLNEDTSWGVGNVMEFQINFGLPGVVIGFLILGFVIGWVDLKAAMADARGDFDSLILFFLLGVALTQPGGSLVEITGGAAAAGAAAFMWKLAWQLWLRRHKRVATNRRFATPR